MNATDDYNCHVLALCPPLRMNAHTSACTHTDWLNWTLVDRRSVNAMRCDAMGMRCHAVCDAMRCDGLTSVWPYTSLNSIGYVCTSYGGCWMTPTSVVWLFWHTQYVSVVVISVSVCAQAVIAAAYMQQPSTSLLRAYANEWVNERTIERTNDRRYQRTNQPTNDATNQRTNKLTN